MQLHQLAGVIFVGMLFTALGIVEVEEHGRALRRGEKQVAEAAERVAADDVAVVDELFADEIGNGNVEMIRPEFDDALEQLALAVNGAEDANPKGSAQDEIVIVDGDPVEFGQRQRENGAAGDELIDARVVNRVRLQLPVDVGFDAHFTNTSNVFGARAPRQPVQDVPLGGNFGSEGRLRKGKQRFKAQPGCTEPDGGATCQMEKITAGDGHPALLGACSMTI